MEPKHFKAHLVLKETEKTDLSTILEAGCACSWGAAKAFSIPLFQETLRLVTSSLARVLPGDSSDELQAWRVGGRWDLGVLTSHVV